MRQHGRKSGARLAVVAGTIQPVQRLEPPAELTPEQRAVWVATVQALPAEWFAVEHVPLLTLYCGHVCNAAEIGALLAKIKPSPGMREDKLRRYQRLLHMREKEARAVSALATRMRITQQAQVHKDVAGRKTEAFVPEAKKPWQG